MLGDPAALLEQCGVGCFRWAGSEALNPGTSLGESAGTDKGERRGRAKCAPAVAETSRGGVEQSGEELLGAVVGESEAEEIGAARVGVFLVVRRRNGGELKE